MLGTEERGEPQPTNARNNRMLPVALVAALAAVMTLSAAVVVLATDRPKTVPSAVPDSAVDDALAAPTTPQSMAAAILGAPHFLFGATLYPADGAPAVQGGVPLAFTKLFSPGEMLYVVIPGNAGLSYRVIVTCSYALYPYSDVMQQAIIQVVTQTNTTEYNGPAGPGLGLRACMAVFPVTLPNASSSATLQIGMPAGTTTMSLSVAISNA
jgi:hypothetical protein